MVTIHSSQRISWGERNGSVCIYSTYTQNIKSSIVTFRHTLLQSLILEPHIKHFEQQQPWTSACDYPVLLQVVVPVPAGVKAGAHLQGPLQDPALISEEKQMQLLLVVQKEHKWEQVLPSNPFQTILWIWTRGRSLWSNPSFQKKSNSPGFSCIRWNFTV